MLSILPQLLEKYQVIHQVGKNNLKDIQLRVSTILNNNPRKDRYKVFDYLNNTALKMTAGASSLVISRAGSSIFEFANWGLPSIIIPIPESISHDQKNNAYTYARSGGAIVIEEENLGPAVLLSEINQLFAKPEILTKMKEGAKTFASPNAGALIAKQLLDISADHESR